MAWGVRWVLLAAWRGNMIRLSLSFFYNLGAVLRPIGGLAGAAKVGQVWGPLTAAQNDLHDLLRTEWFQPAIQSSVAKGSDLMNALLAITNRTDFDSEVGHQQAFAVTNALATFETVLNSELVRADAYFVTRKGAYDSLILVTDAQKHYPSTLAAKVPGAIVDVKEAGKCLAFELCTASGFHILRATESVVRAYWSTVSKGKPHPRLRTIGSYATLMREKGYGDVKVIATLFQIKDLHRNPLIHPQATLDLEEAIALFGICQSAISTMLKVLPNQPVSLGPVAAAVTASMGSKPQSLS